MTRRLFQNLEPIFSLPLHWSTTVGEGLPRCLARNFPVTALYRNCALSVMVTLRHRSNHHERFLTPNSLEISWLHIGYFVPVNAGQTEIWCSLWYYPGWQWFLRAFPTHALLWVQQHLQGTQCGLQNNVLELTPRMLSLKLSAVMVSLVALADCYFSA